MTIRTIIVDDEPLARQSLRVLLEREADVAIAGEAPNGREALALIRREKPDLVFIDVQMPGMNGLDVIRQCAPLNLAVVFVTAYDQYAIKAFETHALDYLLKPYTDERFHHVLDRARRHLKERTLTELGARVLEMLAERPAAQTLAIRDGSRTSLVRVEDIDWIEAADYYARVHTAGRALLMRESLKSLEATLAPAGFVRAHRSALVNTARIREIERLPSGDAVATLVGGQRVKVSRGSSLLDRGSLQHPTTR